jgi:hypothetical protein
VPPSQRASQIPAAPPAAATASDSGTTSAAVSRMSCHRVAPRAVSSAVSSSRCAASSRATASSAATVSTSSCSPLIASSDRARARLLPVSASSVGRLEVSWIPLSVFELFSEAWSDAMSAETADSSLPATELRSGWATQVPVPAVSGPENAACVTISGP